MKLLNLVPAIGDVWTDAMSEYSFQYLRPTTEVITKQIPYGPASIEGEYDEVLAAPGVVQVAQDAVATDAVDGIFVNCFGEPGVRAVREALDVPVFGGFEPSMHMALGIGDKIGIISVLPNVVSMIDGLVARDHLDHRVVCVRSIDIPVLDLQDHDKLVAALTEQAAQAISVDHAEVIVLGCTGMVDVREDVQAALLAQGYDTGVIEAAQSGVMMLESFVAMGLRQSRLTYLTPTDKERTWWCDCPADAPRRIKPGLPR